MFRQLLYYLILFLKCYDGIKVYFMYFNVVKCNLTLLTMRCKRYTCGHCCLKHHANNLEGRCRKGSNGGDSTLLSSKEVTMATEPQSTSQAPVNTSLRETSVWEKKNMGGREGKEASKRKGNSSQSTWQCPCKPPWNPPSIPGNTAALAWF